MSLNGVEASPMGVWGKFRKYFKEVLRGFQKGAPRVSKRSLNGASRELNSDSKTFYASFKACFDEVLVVQFTRYMDLIVATRAEGGLVLFRLWKSRKD